jgi:dTDP-4-dehydrorhamnose 3,5-epimerase-like enzyme
MTEAVVESELKNPVLPLEAPFVDERGAIQPMLSFPKAVIGSAVMITSKKDSVRANHYHKKDWHYCYVVSGAIDYYERKVGSNDEPTITHITAGQVFYTPPMLEHAMVFTEDTVFLTLGGGTRQQGDYEDDLVRVNLV